MRGLIYVSTAACLFAAAAITGAGYVLPVKDVSQSADALVVLGGFGVPRAELAASLFARGAYARVVVTGAGDGDAMRDTLTARGVPERSIVMEPNSRTTQENAINVAAILRAQGLRSAKLVTHWFHARRAIAAFRAAAPEVAFTAASVTPEGSPRWRLGWSSEPQATLSEYVKIVWYAIAHGVFVRLTAEPLGPPA